MTPKSFIIEISPWYMLFMVPNVFPLNPGHWKTYKKTQRSQTSVKGLRKEVLHCESLKLAAILNAILDFEKCSRVSSIHQADFVYVMSEAAESFILNKTTSNMCCLARWISGLPELWGPLSWAVPGKFLGPGGHRKHNCLQYRAKSHRSRAW